MTMSRPIEPGQEYVAAAPVQSEPVPLFVRIRVKGISRYQRGHAKANVVTVTADGREIRHRALSMDQLHDTATTRDGQPRKTGYILDTSKEYR